MNNPKICLIAIVGLLVCGNAFASNVVQVCNSGKHTILIDQLSSNSLRYRAWDSPKNTQDKPDMEITQTGAMSVDGTGVCSSTSYHFTKGNVEFVVDDNTLCTEGTPPESATGNLSVFINGDMKRHSYCID